MELIVVLVLGWLAGAAFVPQKFSHANTTIQLICTGLLIFGMGVTLGSSESFLNALGDLGIASLLYCLVPSLFSIILVYVFSLIWMKGELSKRNKHRAKQDSAQNQNDERLLISVAFGSLVLGGAYALSPLDLAPLNLISKSSELILLILMFFVGISLGFAKGIIEKLKIYHVKALIIPAGIIIGSLTGGLLTSFVVGDSPALGSAIAGGMGWYSLAGVVLGDLAGAEAGSVAFLSNLLREILSFFTIPLIARHLNYLTCIAPAGATSEDTTLPLLIKCTNEETVILAVINGVICSACVPLLLSFLQPLF